jgi:hypothetical protein
MAMRRLSVADGGEYLRHHLAGRALIRPYPFALSCEGSIFSDAALTSGTIPMPRYYFYSADLYTRDETQLTGGYHGIMTVDADTKSASEVFGEVTDLLQSQTQEYIQEIARNSGQPADPQMFYFIVKQFYKVD